MKKFTLIMVLGLALLLMGLTLSASAVVTIASPWDPAITTDELNLYEVFNDPRFAATSFDATTFTTYLATATIVETLPLTDGVNNFEYSITDAYATWAGFTQTPGIYLAGDTGAKTALGFTATADGIINLTTIPLSPTGAFGFYDLTSDGTAGTKYTETTLNPNFGDQSNGLIFDLGNGQYIVVFEDGNNTQPFGDRDYNDLVLKVTMRSTPVPIPPSAMLLGTGLLGLVGLGWRRRRQSS